MLNIAELSSKCVNDIGHSFFVRFSNSKTNKERVDFLSVKVNEHPDIRTQLDIFADVSPDKSLDSALKSKQLGNKNFQGKKYKEAIEQYNKGINSAPFGNGNAEEDKEFAILLANRSACLFHCEEFQQCLNDIDGALNNGYPDNLAYKIWHRGGKCLVKLQRVDSARHYFNNGLECLKTHGDLDEKMKQKWIKSFSDDLKGLENVARVQADTNSNIERELQSLQLKDCDKVIKSFSKSLSLGFAEQCGRYVYATQDISAGEAVAKEEPYSCVLLPDYNLTHCTDCCQRVTTPFPCQQCQEVVYCSYQCQKKSWQNYHKYECHVLRFFDPIPCSRIGHLAVRTFIMGRQSIIHEYKPVQNHNEDGGVQDDEVKEQAADKSEVENPGSKSVKDIEDLMGHEYGSRDGHTNLHLTLMALYLKNVIYETDIFDNPVLKLTKKDTKVFDSFVAEKLLNLIQIVQCNTFNVPEMQYIGDVKHSSPEDIGMALYPQLAYFNHSCDPDLELTFKGNKVTGFLVKDVYKGDQVCVDYGYLFYSDSRGKRRAELKMQYLFECNCTACSKHWPLFDGIESQVPTFKCTKCKNSLDLTKQNSGTVVCDNPCCDNQEDLQNTLNVLSQTHSDYANAVSILESETEENGCEKALPELLKHLSIMGKHICLPWKEYYSCQVMIKQCYRLLGNSYNTSQV